MSREEAIGVLKVLASFQGLIEYLEQHSVSVQDACNMAIQALSQELCEMTAEEYRQRMIQAFHNADTDELIAVCVLPTEKEFEHLEWLLKKHYKKEPCDDALIQLKKYTEGKQNTDKVEISVLTLNRIIKALSQEPTEKPMCDRNICISNEYNGIGCDECIVNKAEQEPCDKCEVGNPCLYCEHEFSQKIEPCDDMVSREAALEKMADYVASGYADSAEDFEEYSRIICQLPSVAPRQKYGKWIEHPEIETSAPEYLMFYECSECGDKQCFCKSDIHKKRFCNNCGAKMVEP